MRREPLHHRPGVQHHHGDTLATLNPPRHNRLADPDEDLRAHHARHAAAALNTPDLPNLPAPTRWPTPRAGEPATATSVILHSLRFSFDLLCHTLEGCTPHDLARPHPITAVSPATILTRLLTLERTALTHLRARALPALPAGPLDPATLLPLFTAHRTLTIRLFESLPADALASPINLRLPAPSPAFYTLGELGNFLGLHTILHAGQLTALYA